jgi:hypothetical protein
MQLQDVGGRPKTRTSRSDLLEMFSLIRKGNGQVAGFSRKLTRYQPITNVLSR